MDEDQYLDNYQPQPAGIPDGPSDQQLMQSSMPQPEGDGSVSPDQGDAQGGSDQGQDSGNPEPHESVHGDTRVLQFADGSAAVGPKHHPRHHHEESDNHHVNLAKSLPDVDVKQIGLDLKMASKFKPGFEKNSFRHIWAAQKRPL